jgi:Glutathione S-transferase
MLFVISALNLKEIPYDIKPVSLIKAGGEQHCNEYREINPMEQVPALHIDGHTLVESVSNASFYIFLGCHTNRINF